MATLDGDSSVLSTGRLSYGCTNLALAYPHGGTALGLIGQVFLRPQRSWAVISDEETGGVLEVQWLGGTLSVGLVAEGWDEDAMNVLNPNAAQSGGRSIVEWPGSDVIPGAPMAPLQNVVFTPHDATNGKGFVIYRAVSVPDINAELSFAAGRFLEVPFLLIATPDGSDRLGKMGKFSDLSL